MPETDVLCPSCRGPVEFTPSGAVTCTNHGSDHLRIVGAEARVLAGQSLSDVIREVPA